MKSTIPSAPPATTPAAPAEGAPANSSPSVAAHLADFPEFQSLSSGSEAASLNHLLDVEVCVTAELGRVTMTIGDILKLGPGSVVGLDRAVSEPIDLLVQGVPFARGNVVVVEDRFAIRIREILDPKTAGKK